MDRRKFLKFAGALGAAEAFLGNLHPALAQTWQKIGGTVTTVARVRTPPLGKWRRLSVIACGYGHSMALRSDGLVYTTGYNHKGQLGAGSADLSKLTYVQAPGISNAVAVFAGHYSSVALRSDGLVFGCGYNSVGCFGDGTTVDKSTFVQAVGISNAIAISAPGRGKFHSLALRSDGLVFAAGFNNKGQLGINNVSHRSTYQQAIGISNAVAVAGGFYHSMALRSDGLVFTCGYNNKGQLGDATGGVGNSKSTYVQAIGISNAVAISGGYYHNVVLRSDGLVFACGYNNMGQLGDNSITSKETFVQAIGISNALAVACGYLHNLALRADGMVFSVGNNDNAQLGDNSTIDKSTYVQAIGISNAVAVACGAWHSIALRSDGLVFACGYNMKGQIGDNTTASKRTFVQATGL